MAASDFETPAIPEVLTVPAVQPGAMAHSKPFVASAQQQESLGFPGELVENWKEVAIEKMAELDFLRLFFMEIDGERVASAVCFDYGNTRFLYNSGYNPAYSQLSVGLLNKALSLQTAIEEGRQSFNFLKGNERYKYNLGGKDEAVYRLTAQR